MFIPGLSAKSPKTAPLRRVVKIAADRSGVPFEAMQLAMLEFLECVVDEIAQGNIIHIPGFGQFTPVLRDVKGGTAKRAKVFFTAALAFGVYVARTCPHAKAEVNSRNHNTYQHGNNVGDVTKCHMEKAPPHSCLAWWKRIIRNNSPKELHSLR